VEHNADGNAGHFLHDPLPEPDLGLPHAVAFLARVLPLPNLVGAGVGMAWYLVQMRRMAQAKPIAYEIGGLRAVTLMWVPELSPLQASSMICLVTVPLIMACWLLVVKYP
jgi:hypothetical protein